MRAPTTTPAPAAPLRRGAAAKASASAAPARPGRALRWARVVWHALFAPTFLYSLYVQLVVLKGPGRTPLPASVGFGRDSVFLTFHGNLHCTWYACLCLLHAILDLAPAAAAGAARRGRRGRRGRVARFVERAAHVATGPLFPLATFVGLAYYLILHFHPLTRLRAKVVPDHDEKMALLHLVPMVFAAGDALLKDELLARRHGFTQQAAARAIAVYGATYFAWSCVCVYINGGHWPYPFQKKFTPIQHLMFVGSVLLVTQYVTRFGFRLLARLDKRRRRRLARAAGVDSAAESLKAR